MAGIGSMRWEVTVQTYGLSGNTVTWSNTTAWAAISTQVAGPEAQMVGQTRGQVNFVLTMRNEVTVTAKDRIVWSGKTLQVQSVRMLNLAYIEVLAVEKQ